MTNLIAQKVSSPKCTVCGETVKDAYRHSLLAVAVCKRCFHSVAPDGEDSCLWCLQHGDLISCVQCSRKCCFKCISKNLGPDYVDRLIEETWSCFVCDPDPLRSLKDEFLIISEDSLTSLIPETTDSSTKISSPIVPDDSEDPVPKKPEGKFPNEDLDFILNMYKKPIRSVLDVDDFDLPWIINEINSVDCDQLELALHSYKKCLAAFAEDLANLEIRIAQARRQQDPNVTLTKLTSLLKILVQHHTFNRLCRIQARMRDESATFSRKKLDTFVKKITTHNSAYITRAPNLLTRLMNQSKRRCDIKDEDEDGSKRSKVSEQTSSITPSWLRNENIRANVAPEDEGDDFIRPKLSRRGRPPRSMSVCDQSHESHEKRAAYISRPNHVPGVGLEQGLPKRMFINAKEPRYFVPKKNGEYLASAPL